MTTQDDIAKAVQAGTGVRLEVCRSVTIAAWFWVRDGQGFKDRWSSAATIVVRQRNGVGPQHPTHVVAAALSLVSGAKWLSLCCWCLEKPVHEGREAFRVRSGYGECSGCAYVGQNCLVAAPPST